MRLVKTVNSSMNSKKLRFIAEKSTIDFGYDFALTNGTTINTNPCEVVDNFFEDRKDIAHMKGLNHAF